MFGSNQWRQLLARGEGDYFMMVMIPCFATDLSCTIHFMDHQKCGNSEENLWQKCEKLLQMLCLLLVLPHLFAIPVSVLSVGLQKRS
jgi:hypothetical protein